MNSVADALPDQTVLQSVKLVDTTTNYPVMLGFNNSSISLSQVDIQQTVKVGYFRRHGCLDPVL